MSADQRPRGWNPAFFDPFAPDDHSTTAASTFQNVTERPSTTRERGTQTEPDSDEDETFIKAAMATLSAVKRRRDEDDDKDLIDVVLGLLESAKKKRRR